MKSELISIDKVIDNTNNPRFIKDEKFKKLVKSIKEFPEMLELRPIVVNEGMIVLGGNMRLKACREAGLKKVHIAVFTDEMIQRDLEARKKKGLKRIVKDEKGKLKELEFTKEDIENEFILKDNASFGEWDLDKLADWGVDSFEDWGIDIDLSVPDEELTDEQVESKYTDENCVYPIIPVFDEKYNAFIIICETETEEAGIRTKFDIPMKAQSYKNKYLGKSNVVRAKDLLRD